MDVPHIEGTTLILMLFCVFVLALFTVIVIVITQQVVLEPMVVCGTMNYHKHEQEIPWLYQTKRCKV